MTCHCCRQQVVPVNGYCPKCWTNLRAAPPSRIRANTPPASTRAHRPDVTGQRRAFGDGGGEGAQPRRTIDHAGKRSPDAPPGGLATPVEEGARGSDPWAKWDQFGGVEPQREGRPAPDKPAFDEPRVPVPFINPAPELPEGGVRVSWMDRVQAELEAIFLGTRFVGEVSSVSEEPPPAPAHSTAIRLAGLFFWAGVAPLFVAMLLVKLLWFIVRLVLNRIFYRWTRPGWVGTRGPSLLRAAFDRWFESRRRQALPTLVVRVADVNDRREVAVRILDSENAKALRPQDRVEFRCVRRGRTWVLKSGYCVDHDLEIRARPNSDSIWMLAALAWMIGIWTVSLAYLKHFGVL